MLVFLLVSNVCQENDEVSCLEKYYITNNNESRHNQVKLQPGQLDMS